LRQFPMTPARVLAALKEKNGQTAI
jgi:hypothetical protein